MWPLGTIRFPLWGLGVHSIDLMYPRYCIGPTNDIKLAAKIFEQYSLFLVFSYAQPSVLFCLKVGLTLVISHNLRQMIKWNLSRIFYFVEFIRLFPAYDKDWFKLKHSGNSAPSPRQKQCYNATSVIFSKSKKLKLIEGRNLFNPTMEVS